MVWRETVHRGPQPLVPLLREHRLFRLCIDRGVDAFEVGGGPLLAVLVNHLIASHSIEPCLEGRAALFLAGGRLLGLEKDLLSEIFCRLRVADLVCEIAQDLGLKSVVEQAERIGVAFPSAIDERVDCLFTHGRPGLRRIGAGLGCRNDPGVIPFVAFVR